MPRSADTQHSYNVWLRVRRYTDKVDPRPHVGDRDGSLLDGPVIDAWHVRVETRNGVRSGDHDDCIPREERNAQLGALFLLLEARGWTVQYADRESGACFPCLEVALDEAYHIRVMAAVAKVAYEHGRKTAASVADALGLHL